MGDAPVPQPGEVLDGVPGTTGVVGKTLSSSGRPVVQLASTTGSRLVGGLASSMKPIVM